MQSAHKSLRSEKGTDISRSSIVDDIEDDAIAIAKLLSILEIELSPCATTNDSSVFATVPAIKTNKDEVSLSLSSPFLDIDDITDSSNLSLNTTMKTTMKTTMMTMEEMQLSNNLYRLKQHDISHFFTDSELKHYLNVNDKSVNDTLIMLKNEAGVLCNGTVEEQSEM